LKRIGFLFDRAFSKESLYQAWLDASRHKMGKRSTYLFSKRLAFNLDALHQELHSGTYRPRPYARFEVYEPKQRVIYGPSFRDLVVQHAIYRLIYPIFNPTLIDQSFACRNGKGTHAAADYAQKAMRKSPVWSYILKLDIRKFFYRIDRDRLRIMLERRIKDRRFLDVMMIFAEYGHPKIEPIGIPIGNLLSQLYALVYLNPLDQFIKRSLKARWYARYVDDFVIFGWARWRCLAALASIQSFLASRLGLELSKFTLSPVGRGLNFVGYRTWRSRRFIRRHSLHKASKAAKRGKLDSLIAILGHARNTASWRYLLNLTKGKHHAIFNRLPKSHRCGLYA